MSKICLDRFLLGLMMMPGIAVAHSGHGNTPVHALIHMFEDNGLLIGLILLVALGSLVFRSLRLRATRRVDNQKQGYRHDPR